MTIRFVHSAICTPMRVTLCQKFNVQYGRTTLPNKFGLYDQAVINDKLTSTYLIILGIKCYTLLPLFLCSQYAPKCNSSGHTVPMCRKICKGMCLFDFWLFASDHSLFLSLFRSQTSLWLFSGHFWHFMARQWSRLWHPAR